MSRSFVRLVAVLLAVGGLCGSLTSAAPFASTGPVSPPRLVAAAMPLEEVDQTPRHLRLVPSATPIPSPTPTASPQKKVAVARPLATARPIPVPAIDAQEIVLLNLDPGRFLLPSNSR